METIKISKNIATLRKKTGITQEDLANKLNVSNQAVSKWEAGKCYPDIELLPELASLFGISIDELLLGDCLNKVKSSIGTNDTMVLRAIKMAQDKKYISPSILQRFLSIGYSTAKRIIEDMCKCGYLKKDTTASVDRYLYIGDIKLEISQYDFDSEKM